MVSWDFPCNFFCKGSVMGALHCWQSLALVCSKGSSPTCTSLVPRSGSALKAHSNSRGSGQQHLGARQLPLPIHKEFLHLCFQECEILDIIMKMCCEYPCAASPALLGSSLGEGWHPSTPRPPCPAMGELQQGLAAGGSQPSASNEVLEEHRVLRGLDVSSTL